MRKTNLKPLQVQDLITDCIDSTMNGNAGIACSRLRRAFNCDKDDDSTKELMKLNKDLILLELETRKKMKELIKNFIDGERVE